MAGAASFAARRRLLPPAGGARLERSRPADRERRDRRHHGFRRARLGCRRGAQTHRLSRARLGALIQDVARRGDVLGPRGARALPRRHGHPRRAAAIHARHKGAGEPGRARGAAAGRAARRADPDQCGTRRHACRSGRDRRVARWHAERCEPRCVRAGAAFSGEPALGHAERRSSRRMRLRFPMPRG